LPERNTAGSRPLFGMLRGFSRMNRRDFSVSLRLRG
jgi:hypothetical protein